MLSTRATRILRGLVIVLASLFMLLMAVGIYSYGLYQDLPDLDPSAGGLPVAKTSVVYGADGSVIAEWHGEQDRTIVTLEEIPVALRQAVVAVEDERFYSHSGVDIGAITRAFTDNMEAGEVVQGGSTITQQLVKLMIGGEERTLTRKLKEALLAYQLEARADKDRVLESYLNLVYLGHGWYGVEAAAQNYFGKSASELDVAESAMIAALIRSPGRYSPKIDPDAAEARKNLVLAKMEEQGYLDATTASGARASEISLAPPREASDVAPHFVEYVKQDLIDRLGADAVFEGGLRVHTTLDPGLQELAESAARSVLPSEDDPDLALVALEHATGAVRAMVGGRDFTTTQFNLAVQGRRQPGSAFKPFVLVAAMEAGVSPNKQYATSPYSVPVTDGQWHVENYEGSFPDSVLSLRDATIWSVNAVFARLIVEIGPEAVVETAKKMGIESPLEPNPAIALGGLTEGVSPLEMASAYGTVASGGLRLPPHAITRVTDESGKVLFEPRTTPERVLPEVLAVETSLILHDVIEKGTGTAASCGEWAAGKTGTTQSYRDAWFVGYSGDLVTSVWVGYPEGQVEMVDVHGVRVSGGTFPARIWKAFMTPAVVRAAAPLSPPGSSGGESAEGSGEESVLAMICTDTYLLANGRCPEVVELYLDRAQVPSDVCQRH